MRRSCFASNVVNARGLHSWALRIPSFAILLRGEFAKFAFSVDEFVGFFARRADAYTEHSCSNVWFDALYGSCCAIGLAYGQGSRGVGDRGQSCLSKLPDPVEKIPSALALVELCSSKSESVVPFLVEFCNAV